jgi:two-component system alkaline phosphatase synthesis response regulator PhoP
LTAKGQEADRERGMSVGATAYMTKPFDPDDVLEYAKSALDLND